MEPLKAVNLGFSLLLVSGMLYAADPADAPYGTTALCKDGTFYSGPIKQGACSEHHGVKEWYNVPPASASPSTPNAIPPATEAPTTSSTPERRAPTTGTGTDRHQ